MTHPTTFSIQKVKGPSGIKGNVKADMLAERGRFEICKTGRYLVSKNNSSPIHVLPKFSSKFFEFWKWFHPEQYSEQFGRQ